MLRAGSSSVDSTSSAGETRASSAIKYITTIIIYIHVYVQDRYTRRFAPRSAPSILANARLHSTTSPKIASACITAFRALRSPFCVALKSCFVSNRALFFLHDYLPGCATMYDLYFEKQTSLSERTLWSYIVQLLLGVRSVHGSGLAVRCLKVKRVLITRDSKLKIGGLGIVDVLEFEDRKRLEDLRREDLKDVGRVILSVGSRLEVDKSTSPEVVKKAIGTNKK